MNGPVGWNELKKGVPAFLSLNTFCCPDMGRDAKKLNYQMKDQLLNKYNH